MVSRALSPDRLGQVISSQQQGPGGNSVQAGGESAPVHAAPAPTTVSAAEVVHESRQQSAVVSEGVASAGAPQAVVGECTGDAPVSGPQGYQGETSGQTEPPGGGSNYGFGENGAGSPMDCQASVLLTSAGDTGGEAPSHFVSHAKRKISEMGEVDESPAAAMQQQDPERKHAADGMAGRLDRVPSDLAMVVGETDGLAPQLEQAGAAAGALQLGDDCDSNAVKQPSGADAAAEPVRPSDAEILEWEEQIKKAEVQSQALIGGREPMSALEAEYAAGSLVFRQKIAALAQTYGAIRRARGDGNCFFRSFLFGYLEGLVLSQDEVEKARMLRRLDELKQTMKDCGYDDFVLEPPLDIVLEMLRSIASPVSPLTIPALESNLRDDNLSNYCVFLLRMITTCEIKRRADFFAPFIMGLSDVDVDTFCSRHVDPMGEESDHVQLVALTDALQVPVRVVYLDRSTAPAGAGTDGESVHVDIHDFVPDACQGQHPCVHVLYRPGHYDILYETDQSG